MTNVTLVFGIYKLHFFKKMLSCLNFRVDGKFYFGDCVVVLDIFLNTNLKVTNNVYI